MLCVTSRLTKYKRCIGFTSALPPWQITSLKFYGQVMFVVNSVLQPYAHQLNTQCYETLVLYKMGPVSCSRN